jgi:hypothetical protein
MLSECTSHNEHDLVGKQWIQWPSELHLHFVVAICLLIKSYILYLLSMESLFDFLLFPWKTSLFDLVLSW